MRRILVVEDSASTRSFIRSALESCEAGPCDITEARAGSTRCVCSRAGLTTWSSPTSTCPTSTGSSSCSSSARASATARRRSIIISTQSSEKDRERGMSLGADEYLAKPLEPDGARASGRPRLVVEAGPRRRADSPMADMGDKAREEFFSEAQEIVEGLSRDLLRARRRAAAKGRAEPELVNDVFRAVHTLKGLAGPLRRAAMSGALARAREPARRSAPRQDRAHASRCSTSSSAASSSTGASSRSRRACAKTAADDVDDFIRELGESPRRPAAASQPLRRALRARSRACSRVLTEYEEHGSAPTSSRGSALPAARAVRARDHRRGARRAEAPRQAARRDHHATCRRARGPTPTRSSSTS